MTYPHGPISPSQWTAGEQVTAVKMQARVDAQFNAIQADLYADWSSYTVSFASTGTTPTLGTGGTGVGRYKVLADHVAFFEAIITWGTTPTAGTGTYLLGLPPGFPWAGVGGSPQFHGLYLTAGGVAYRLSPIVANATQVLAYIGDGTVNALDPTHPVAPANGNKVFLSGHYHC